jgi:TRAP-type mannitol/chloroaromatic compound transport system permease small subunit
MSLFLSIQRAIDSFTETSGRVLLWFSLLMMITVCVVVTLRYVFGIGAIPLQEFSTYLHSSVFMLGAAYTLKHDGHVRVDILYRNFSARKKAWVNSLGTLIFLLPICAYIFIISWGFVSQSWQIMETSAEPGGIPAVFLLKTLIPLMAFNLALQGIAEILRNALFLTSPTVANTTTPPTTEINL